MKPLPVSPPAVDRAPRILCDGATYQHARRVLEFSALPPVTVKGKVETVPVFRPLAARRALEGPDDEREAVGREAEASILDGAIERVRRGERAGAVVLVGEPGIGKSVLIAQALSKARSIGGVRVVHAAASDVEKTTPYFVWRGIFAELLGLEGESSQHARDGIQARLTDEPQLSALAPLLNAVLPLGLPDSPLTAQLTGEVRADNTRRLLLTLLETLATAERIVIALEDAHWFDSASWALLHLVCESRSVGVLVTTRHLAEARPPEADAIQRLGSTQWITLEAFSLASTRLLLQRVLKVGSVPDALVSWVHHKTGGNPFFMEQLASALSETGALIAHDGRCQLANTSSSLDDVDLPDTLHGIVTTRLDRLTAAEQLTVKIASVIGRVFELATLHDIHPVNEAKPALAGYLETLQRLDIAAPENKTDAAYFFRHVILHEVAYSLLLVGQRSDLHRKVGEWYEERFRDDLSPYYGLLAWHFERAGQVDKALDYLDKAGERAHDAHANRETISILSRALELDSRYPELSDPLRQARWETRLGDAWYAVGNLQEASRHVSRATRLLGMATPTSTIGLALAIVVELVMQLLHRLLPSAWYSRGGQAAEKRRLATRAYQRMSEIAFFRNESLSMAYFILASMNSAEVSEPSPELAHAYAQVSILAAVAPIHPVARFYSRRSVEVAKLLADSGSIAYALMIRGLYQYGIGSLGEAREALGAATKAAESLADARRREETSGLLAEVLLLEGEVSQAQRLRDEVFALAQARSDLQPQIWGLLGRFVAAMHVWSGRSPFGRDVGPATEATAWPDAAAKLLSEHPVKNDEIYAHGLRAVAYRCRGDHTSSRAAAERAIVLMERALPTSVYAMEGYCGAVESAIALYAGNRSDRQLRALARRGCRQLRRFARVFAAAQPRMLLFESAFASSLGQSARATSLARRSLDSAAQLGMPYDQVRAHVLLSKLLDGDAEASVHCERAQRICATIGASAVWADFQALGAR